MLKRKKFIIFLIIILLLIVAGGVFWWWQKREIKGSPEDYVIKETTEGKFVENKKAGLTARVPEGWTSQIIEFQGISVAIESPDIEGERRYDITKPPFKKGCGIEITVAYEKTNFNELTKIIKEINTESGVEPSELEIITINNRQCLKNTFESSVIGPSMTVYFIQDAKIFGFALRMAPNEKERCIQEFNKFLETVSINPS